MEEDLNVLTRSANRLVDLASQSGLHIASSPGAHRVLEACILDIELATSRLSQQGVLAIDQDLRDFYLAKLGGIINSLQELLSAIVRARHGPSAVNELVGQLGGELLMVVHEIEQPFAANEVDIQPAPGRKIAKVIQFPGHPPEPVRSENPNFSPSTEQNAAADNSAFSQLPRPKSDRIDEVKRKHLEKQKALLLEQYDVTSRQLRYTLSEADKIVLNQKIEDLEGKIKMIEEDLDQSPN